MLLQRTARFSTGNLPLLDGTLISSGQSSPHHASTPLSVNGVDGLIRSKSLNQFVVRRRQSAEIRRQRELQRRPRTFSKRLKFLALFFALPAMLIGCTLWQFPSAIAELFGASDASRGSSRVSSVSSTAVSDAFSASSSKLEVTRYSLAFEKNSHSASRSLYSCRQNLCVVYPFNPNSMSTSTLGTAV
jgi:hypothetical protein